MYPKLNVMPEFYVDDLYISPSEFVDQCSSKEIDQLIEVLIEDKYITKPFINIDNQTPDGELFLNAVIKLGDNKHRLTNEEEKIIMQIANRL